MQPRGAVPQPSSATLHTNSRSIQWREHRDTNGRVYLSNPTTGETRWLWTRHNDPATNRDYLANYLTGAREWVTPQNAHLCPAPSGPPVSARPPQRSKVGAKSASAQLAMAIAFARQQCGPDEAPVRNPVTGRIDIRNKKTGVTRALFQPTEGGAPVAALLVQRTYRMLAVRRLGLVDKLRALRDAVGDVEALIAPGKKYDIRILRRTANSSTTPPAERKAASQLLLQLGEFVTQAMLKVDGIESHGIDIIRNRRKRSVKRLLALTETIEDARAKLNQSN